MTLFGIRKCREHNGKLEIFLSASYYIGIGVSNITESANEGSEKS